MVTEKYLIYKKGTHKIECTDNVSQGNCNETVLLEANHHIRKAILYDTYKQASSHIDKTKEIWEKCNGKCALYLYNNKTIPDDLAIGKYFTMDSIEFEQFKKNHNNYIKVKNTPVAKNNTSTIYIIEFN